MPVQYLKHRAAGHAVGFDQLDGNAIRQAKDTAGVAADQAVLGFFVVPVLSLLFLLAGERVPTGAVRVTISGGDVRHETATADPDAEFTRILSVARSGESGETYAFDQHGLMISRSRFDDQLKKLARYLQPFFMEPPPEIDTTSMSGWTDLFRVGRKFSGMSL